MIERAVLVDGPDWWGSVLLLRDGSAAPFPAPKERADEVIRELAVTAQAIEDLDPRVLVIATSGVGARSAMVAAASRAGRPIMTVSGGSAVEGSDLNGVVMAAVRGMSEGGAKVKAVVFDLSDDSPIAGELRSAGLFVRVYTPGDPEPSGEYEDVDPPD